MANTFELIASSTVGAGGASSIDFTSIPSTYTDLCLVLSLRSTNASGNNTVGYNVRFNGVTTNRTYRRLYDDTGTVGSDSSTGMPVGTMNGTTGTASTFSSASIYVPNYAGSSNKSVSIDSVSEANATAVSLYLVAGLWSSTAAINQITVVPDSANFAEFSTAYLYGVKNA